VQGQTACDAIVSLKVKDARAELRGLNMVVLRDDDTGRTFMRFLCLPDTVDPRGPKIK
jgi:hypothetical protein